MVALKALPDNSDISVILVLASIDCLFSFSWRFGGFPVSCYDKLFLVGTSAFLYYGMRFWVSFKPSVLGGFALLQQGRGVLPPYCQVEIETQVAWSPLKPKGDWYFLLLLGPCGSSSFPCGLHWAFSDTIPVRSEKGVSVLLSGCGSPVSVWCFL